MTGWTGNDGQDRAGRSGRKDRTGWKGPGGHDRMDMRRWTGQDKPFSMGYEDYVD
jgi:hypothetical protein